MYTFESDQPIESASVTSCGGPTRRDKFTLTRGERSSVVRPMMIWGTTFDKLEAIKAATNLPYTAILDAMVRFCEQRLEIVGDEPECGQ
jgi:hypothetical protein